MEKVNIAIVTSDTLSYLGVKKLLEDIPAVTVCHIADAAGLIDGNADRFDVIVADAAVCMSHLQFFLPRRSKTLVISDKPLVQPAFDFINRTDSAQQLSEKLIDYIDKLRTTASPQSELSRAK